MIQTQLWKKSFPHIKKTLGFHLAHWLCFQLTNKPSGQCRLFCFHELPESPFVPLQSGQCILTIFSKHLTTLTAFKLNSFHFILILHCDYVERLPIWIYYECLNPVPFPFCHFIVLPYIYYHSVLKILVFCIANFQSAKNNIWRHAMVWLRASSLSLDHLKISPQEKRNMLQWRKEYEIAATPSACSLAYHAPKWPSQAQSEWPAISKKHNQIILTLWVSYCLNTDV